MSKRGQITLFIILGVSILLVLSLFLYFKTNSSSNDSSAYSAIKDSVPSELMPFKSYIEECSENLLWEAVQRAGYQGGIIYPDDFNFKFNYYSQTESDGLLLFENSEFKIPYWYYIKGDNECTNFCTESFYPPRLEGSAPATIQSQIEKYIENNFGKCLENKEELLNLGYTFQSSKNLNAEVEFSESDVRVIIDNKMDVFYGDSENQIRYFRSKVPIPFRKYYNDALSLAGVLYKTKALDKATLNWISAYSGMDSSKLPPKSGSNSDFVSSLFWTAYDVKKDLMNIVSANIPLFTLTSSKNYHPVTKFSENKYFQLKEKYYNDFIIPSPEEFKKYNVHFNYNGWEPYINLNNGEQLLRPESVSLDFFPWFGVNRIRTMYSVSYPVLISLDDPNDRQIDGKGFVFNFAYEVNIRNNAVMNSSYEAFDYSEFDEFTGGTSMICNYEQRTSMPVSLKVINGKTNKPEKGVFVTLVCGEESCPLGETDKDGLFNASMPPCNGGLIQLLKPEFETIFIKENPNIFESIDVGNLVLEPYRFLNISGKRLRFGRASSGENTVWDYMSQPLLLLDNDEEVIVILERTPEDTGKIIKDKFSTVAVLNKNSRSIIKLLPGTYIGNLIYVKNKEVAIPPNKRCFDGGTFGGDECVTIPEERVVLEKWTGGGIYFTNSTAPLIIKKEDIDLNTNLEFKIIYVDLPGMIESQRFIEDLESLSNIEEYSAKYRDLLEPTYSK